MTAATTLFAGIITIAAALGQQQQQPFDLIIEGGRVLDGTGSPWYRADVGITAGRIAAIGKLNGMAAKRRIDVKGLIVSPGFIDIHSHAARFLEENPTLESHVRQGITSVIEGPDGGAPLPLAPALANLTKIRPSINFGFFTGHNSIRTKVMGTANRKATPKEIEQMKALAKQDMIDGAFGLATGLFYVPGNYAPTEEVIEIAKAVAPFGGMHISHMRDEAAKSMDSVRETIRIGEEGGLPTQVTHHKLMGKANWGMSKDTLKLVEDARKRGVDVTIDQYPYTASHTGTAALFPQWSLEGGSKSFRERMAAPDARDKIRTEIARRIREDRGGGDPKNVQFSRCAFDHSLDGKTLADATKARGKEPNIENAAEVAMEIQAKGGCSAIYHAISEEDVVRIMQAPWTMVASDGEAPVFNRESPHPRAYGTFPRVLGRYVRELHVLTLEDAVRRMTAMPASRLKLMDRGLLRPGFRADVIAFDPDQIVDRSEFTKPHQYSEGVQLMIVNGDAVMVDGKLTGARPGQALYGPGKR